MKQIQYLLIVLLCIPLYATVINVPGDFATIQGGLDAAVEGDTVQVDSGTYIENIIWPAINGIKLIGSGEENCIIDGDSLSCVIQILGSTDFEYIIDSTTIISGFTLRNGYFNEYNTAGGGLYIYFANVFISDIIIKNNIGDNGGGLGIRYCNPTIENVIIKNNLSIADGGGIYSLQSDLTLYNVTISENISERYGGGIFSQSGSINLDNVEVSENISEHGGGGLYCLNASSVSIENSFFNGNLTEGNGGGLEILGGWNSTILNNVVISNNSAEIGTYNAGGGIYCSGVNPIITNVTITGNIADYGGGIYCTNANPNILNSILVGNSSQEIYFSNSETSICTVTVAFSDVSGGVGSIETNDNGIVYWDNGNIDEAPLFCQPGEDNFTLAENSPCVETGQNGANMGALDVGCTQQLFINNEKISITSDFTLHQNFPNPFNPTTRISYDLPEDANVSISIYDLMGRKIRTLVSEKMSAGSHITQWDASNDMGSQVSAGVYIYTISADDFREVKKMILLK